MDKQRGQYKLTNIWVDEILLNNITDWCEYQYEKDSYRLWNIGFTNDCRLLEFSCDKESDFNLFTITWSDVIHDNT